MKCAFDEMLISPMRSKIRQGKAGIGFHGGICPQPDDACAT
jgi:hypothetical protein